MTTRKRPSYTLNIDGQLLSLDTPLVMGILNATQESFYEASRTFSSEAIALRVQEMLDEGADIIDIGACSTKPGATPVSEEEEMSRLDAALHIVRKVAPNVILSVDTFRASVAERCVLEHGVQIINDVSGGVLDDRMFDTVARLQVPYILTHSGYGKNGQNEINGFLSTSHPNLWQETMFSLAERIGQLHLMGVNDIIVDPGFGFGKSLDDNYNLMAHMEELHALECPLLVGISRKSMIYKQFDCTPDEALNGTTALHAVALMKGAHILRVHDVKAAVETVKITQKLITHNS